MKKYERFEKRTSVVSAHLPSCIGDVNIGDNVKVMECRPLSKTVSFCVVKTQEVLLDEGHRWQANRGLPTAARLHVADNTGAKVVQILNVLKLGGTMRRYPSAGRRHGQSFRQKGTPDTRRQKFNAVNIRQRRPFRRVDGTWVKLEDNACVIVNEKGDVTGSDIKGPVAREAAERWPRIAANAKQIV